MKEKITLYKKCPIKRCREISGFYLEAEEIKKNEKYICQGCTKETKLSRWQKSSEGEYLKCMCGAESSGKIKSTIPTNKRKYGRQPIKK